MILEEEGALLAAPKEAVAVAFICKLRGFRLLSLCRHDVPCKTGERSAEVRRGSCVLRRNLAREWAAPNWKQPKWQKCIEANHLLTRGENFIWLPAVNFSHSSDRKALVFSFLSPERCTIIPENDLASVTYLWTERERGRRLP